MIDFSFADLVPILPEMFIAGLAMLLLVFGLFGGKERGDLVLKYSVLALIAAAVVLLRLTDVPETQVLGAVTIDAFASVIKVVIVLSAAAALVMSRGYLTRENLLIPEYPVLVLFSVLGMMVMVSADNLIALYMGLELQSLCLYVMAAMARDQVRSSEAGLKYFVLGALSSGILLFGASLIYGFTGSIEFKTIATTLGQGAQNLLPLMFGMVLMIVGMAFKVSAVPFHMWTPDVYEGAPTPVTAFFALVPKIAAMALMMRVLLDPFGEIFAQWQQVIVLLAVASMALGAVAGIVQDNIKRLLAYSSIGHVGFMLIGLATGTFEGVNALLLYLVIYVVTSAGAFAVVLAMKRKDQVVESISDLSGLARSQPGLALAMTLLMFSMAGIPPLAGFFGKFFVFMAAIEAQMYALAVFGVVASVVSAYYYLRIIKVMYFDEPPIDALDKLEDRGIVAIIVLATLFVLLFVVAPQGLLSSLSHPAQVLMQ